MNPLKSKSGITLGLMDVFLNLMVVIILALGILLLFINDPKKKDNDEVVEPIGSMMVEMFWGDMIPVDMDLWVDAPEDIVVGFSRKSGLQFDLLRDDLGLLGDMARRNYEIMIGKDVIVGLYKINVKWYSSRLTGAGHEERGPGGRGSSYIPSYKEAIEVRVVVSLTMKDHDTRQLIARSVTVNPNQEVNVFNFTITADFKLDEDSIYYDPNQIISIDGSGMP